MRDEITLGKRTVRKVFWHLMPYLFVIYVACFVDRVNLGFAALSMNKDLRFSNAVFGFGAGIFFLGYFLAEIPGNIILSKVGAKIWITRIMVTWGIISGLTAIVSTPMQFYLVRFFLGLAEASFFPGIVYYLGLWFRTEDQGKATALFLMGVPASSIIASPISAYLLGVGWFGLAGWKWLFILESAPSVILGVVTFFYLTNKPANAKWLDEDERNWLVAALAKDSAKKEERKKHSVWTVFRDRDVIIVSIVILLFNCGMYGMTIFMPILVKGLSNKLTVRAVGYLVTIPFLVGVCTMYFNGRHSDKTGERRWHTVGAFLVGAFGFVCSALLSHVSVFASMAFFTIAAAGLYSCYGPMWSIPNTFLSSTVAGAAGIAMINSIGNLGGFFGPYAMGYIRDATGSFTYAILFLAACFVAGAILITTLRVGRTQAKEKAQVFEAR